MSKRGLFFAVGTITGLVLAAVFQPLAAWRASAQPDGCQLFPRTGKSANVNLCTDYKPTSSTVDYVDLIIAKIGDAGPFTIRYVAP